MWPAVTETDQFIYLTELLLIVLVCHSYELLLVYVGRMPIRINTYRLNGIFESGNKYLLACIVSQLLLLSPLLSNKVPWQAFSRRHQDQC